MQIYDIPGQREINYPVGLYLQGAAIYAKNSVESLLVNKVIQKNMYILLWCRGSSGSILASMAASILFSKGFNQIAIRHVKKSGEDAHSSGRCSTFDAFNIVIDDFSASGETIRSICDAQNFSFDCLILSSVKVDKDYSNNKLISSSLPFPTPRILITPKSYLRGSIKHLRLLKHE